jgi:Ser-tRNA(Ala) deacylase AlaX
LFSEVTLNINSQYRYAAHIQHGVRHLQGAGRFHCDYNVDNDEVGTVGNAITHQHVSRTFELDQEIL